MQANQVFQLVYTPLVTYNHEEGEGGTEIIPGLAEAVPEPTNGGKTYEFTLRKGIVYSDGTPVKASDFENTMKRLLKLGSVWSSFYSGIVGAPEFQEKGDFRRRHRRDRDRRQDRQDHDQPGGAGHQGAVRARRAVHVPDPGGEVPRSRASSSLRPESGPYVLDIVDFTREYVLTKNPKFDLPGIPKGNFDKITVNVSDSVTKMTQDVINGEARLHDRGPDGRPASGGAVQVPRPLFRGPQPAEHVLLLPQPQRSRRSTSMEARQAVNYALDSNALVRLFGGRLTPGCTFLPPDLIGYKDYECAYGDPDGKPDLEKAEQLVKELGLRR